ncbi:MAG: hybrid sensor histidine kinase/response regulator [Rhodoferax sp.]
MQAITDTASRPVILVVDDTPQNLALMRDLLDSEYTVKLAPSGERALKIAQAQRLDLILLDIMMPDIDGYEVCRQLKASPVTADIPVIFLTAKTDTQDEQLGFALGAADYIVKPISPPIVLARVKAHLLFKEARDALERRNREDKLRFATALSQQVELSQLKSTFVAMTSHEFRTPLTSILVSQSLLRNYCDRLPVAERNGLLDSIESAVKRMVLMLDQVLTIGHSDVHLLSFNPKPANLLALCRQLRDEAVTAFSQGKIEGAHVELDADFEDSNIVLDEKLLRHILGNLLSNAIKYSPGTARVLFKVRCQGLGLTFDVQDQGIGIPAKDLPHLFGDFHRASNVGNIPGTGLGLAIVKRAVQSHGGSITVTSRPGEGTCFTVTIPLTTL